MRRLLSVLLLLLLANKAMWAAEPKVELLWPQGAPGAKGDKPADRPTLTVFLPDAETARFSVEESGPELMSLLVGSEGTLGVVTKAWLRILPLPEAEFQNLLQLPENADFAKLVAREEGGK